MNKCNAAVADVANLELLVTLLEELFDCNYYRDGDLRDGGELRPGRRRAAAIVIATVIKLFRAARS